MSWQPPWDTNGDLAHVRVTASLLGTPIGDACLENLALRAHPEVYPREEQCQPRRYSPYETFGLGIVRDAILAVENDTAGADPTRSLGEVARDSVNAAAATVTDRMIPEAMRRWAVVATEAYLETSEALCAQHDLRPGPPAGWRLLHQGRDYATTEMTTWGLAYLSSDTRVRESWLLRIKPLSDASPIAAQTIAAAAFMTATGIRTVAGDKPSQPHSAAADQEPAPDLVRVRVISLADGGDKLLWEGTPDDARLAWAPHRPLAAALTSGGAVKPGSSCVTCKARPVCAALPSTPGLLGLPTFGTHPRSLAPTALAVYRMCPARYLLTKVIHLPRAYQTSTAAMQRGLDIHNWLQHAHNRELPCQANDLPDSPSDIGRVAESAGLDLEAYRRALPYLRQHLNHCPLTRRVSGVWAEREVVIQDLDADVTVSTRPDLLLTTAGGPIWRETKTMARLPAATDTQLLSVYPQLALAVCALADDAIGEPFVRTGGPALAELEMLAPDTSRTVTYDCADELTVLAARRAIAETADAWHRDDTFLARPGSHCAGCEVARWCPSAFAETRGGDIVNIAGMKINTGTGEVLAATEADRDTTAEEAVAVAAITDPPDFDDDPPPF